MFTRIVVPLDGTPFAEAALAPACELARVYGSHLLVVRAVGAAGLPRTAPPLEKALTVEHLEEADAYLHDIVNALRGAGFAADVVLYVTAPGAAIAQAAELDHADLIVMTAHPRWGVGFLDDTSTTLQVVARSRVPILAWRLGPGVAAANAQALIEERAPLAAPDTPILVPLDGSRFAEAALPVAEDLARRFGAYLVLVRAADDESAIVATFHGDGTPGTEEITAEQEARAYLQRAQAVVESQRLGVTVIVRVGGAANVIDMAWRENNAGLIVMASHGKTGMATRFLGSVAARTIEEVHAPVLVVRPEVRGREAQRTSAIGARE